MRVPALRDWGLPAAAPFNEALGIDVVELHADGASVRMEVREEHRNVEGVVHGGAIFTLADTALGFGISMALRKPCTTAEMKVNYLRPATAGVLEARSRILHAGSRLVVARADVRAEGACVAEALSTFAILEPGPPR